MAKIPTREESGRKILAIYNQDGVRVGEMIQWQSLHPRFTEDSHWRTVDFDAGIQWCIERGFLEERTPKMYFLTESGFAEA